MYPLGQSHDQPLIKAVCDSRATIGRSYRSTADEFLYKAKKAALSTKLGFQLQLFLPCLTSKYQRFCCRTKKVSREEAHSFNPLITDEKEHLLIKHDECPIITLKLFSVLCCPGQAPMGVRRSSIEIEGGRLHGGAQLSPCKRPHRMRSYLPESTYTTFIVALTVLCRSQSDDRESCIALESRPTCSLVVKLPQCS